MVVEISRFKFSFWYFWKKGIGRMAVLSDGYSRVLGMKAVVAMIERSCIY